MKNKWEGGGEDRENEEWEVGRSLRRNGEF
jgi:hypothetical protein